jgi:hypothetical protein
MWIVAIEIVYVFWLINPAFHHKGIHIHWTHLTAFVGVGGLWIYLFLRYLKQLPLLPPNDHRIPELEAQLNNHGHGHAPAKATNH